MKDSLNLNDDTMSQMRHEKFIELYLSNGEKLLVNEIMLATGFRKKIPGGELIKDFIETNKLNVSKYCGYPIVNEGLCWHSTKMTVLESNMSRTIGGSVYVTGALAELELGPS